MHNPYIDSKPRLSTNNSMNTAPAPRTNDIFITGHHLSDDVSTVFDKHIYKRELFHKSLILVILLSQFQHMLGECKIGLFVSLKIITILDKAVIH